MVNIHYKNTEIGKLPQDWDCRCLGKIFNITSSKRVFQSEWKTLGVPFLRAREIAVMDEGKKPTYEIFITEELYKKYTATYGAIREGDLLITGVGTVGKVYVVKDNDKFYFKDGNIIWLKNKNKLCCPYFIKLLFYSPIVINQILENSSGSTVVTYTIRNAQRTLIPFPKIEEQQAIAEALSNIDHLIASTEKLIAKKKAVKQGMMQELLTGKRRLPGFTKPWKGTTLGTCLSKIIGGGTPARKVAEYWNGKIPWVTVKDFTTFSPNTTQEYITQQGLTNSASHLIPAGILLIATRMSVGRVSIYNVDVAINQDLKALFPANNTSSKFLFFLLSFLQTQIEKLGTGSTVNGIRVEQLRDFEIFFPSSIEEQKGIAKVLSELDVEIERQTEKLNKQKQIKQGMMSELLTGRIRLLQASDAKEKDNVPQSVSVSTKDHNEQFDDAVLISAIVNAFYSPKYYLGRKKVQKLLYLARRHQNAPTDGFLKKAAGPYNPSVRYSGGEKIAIDSHYIAETKSDKGSSFAPGKAMTKALDYAAQWNFAPLIDWLLQNFKYTSVNDLEVLATVDMAICDLKAAGIAISLEAVKDVIRKNPEWVPKLVKTYFCDQNITSAIIKHEEIYGKIRQEGTDA